MNDANPLLEAHPLPPFSRIRPEHVEPAIQTLLRDNLAAVEALLQGLEEPSWQKLAEPLHELEDRLAQSWSPVSHLNSVMDSDALRAAYNACLPALSDYSSSLGQNEALFQAWQAVREREGATLDQARRQELDNVLLDFRLAGVALSDTDKARFASIRKRLSELGSRFGENVLDATMAWTRQVTDPAALSGLPESAREQARAAAEAKGLEGWLFTLNLPSYLPVMQYAEDRTLRQEMYEAYVSRASDTGPHAGQWDNRPLIEEILALRHELAGLLGYASFAEFSLARKMARSPEAVLSFLEDLADRTLPAARVEFEELRAYARDELGLQDLQAWDIPFASERLRQARFAISQEELRPWFPLGKVLDGLFEITSTLYGVSFHQREDVDRWHPDVRYYEVLRDGAAVAGFYLDPFAREHKKGGAWMDECRVRRRRADGSLQIPVAYLVCNFTAPVGGKPSLLSHAEVNTLFHEFGHGLHHMLTQVDSPGVSGINGVAWDAVELPSQLMENWCWERETLPLISGHIDTGAPLPEEKLERLLAARNFQAGMQMLRQLEFALFDFRLHAGYQPGSTGQAESVLREVRERTALYPVPDCNRFQNSFSHIFAGGYAAGYYSYKWAEVLSADVFERFRERGVLAPEAGREFLDAVLARGGERPAAELFRAYRGRDPDIAALLRASGLAEAQKPNHPVSGARAGA